MAQRGAATGGDRPERDGTEEAEGYRTAEQPGFCESKNVLK